MAQTQTEPKLFLPALQPFYDAAVPLSWLVIRVAVGWNLLVHGWGKIMVGPTDAFLKAFSDLGFTPPAFWFWSSFLIEMLVICVTYWNSGVGFSWLKRGYEYVLLWGLLCFAIALRGGGPYSLDRKLGREL